MVIVYDLETKEILSTEDNTLIPALPFGTEKQKREILRREGRDYVSIPDELGASILDHELIFDEEGNFIRLMRKPEQQTEQIKE